jgi:5-methylcytosine-specific restriction endonuclease McrA
MQNNPICERCEARGRVTPTSEVHHKKPFDTGRTEEEIEELAFDYDNLKSVCEPCHEEAHKELKNIV